MSVIDDSTGSSVVAQRERNDKPALSCSIAANERHFIDMDGNGYDGM